MQTDKRLGQGPVSHKTPEQAKLSWAWCGYLEFPEQSDNSGHKPRAVVEEFLTLPRKSVQKGN